MNRRIEVSTTNVHAAKVILGSILEHAIPDLNRYYSQVSEANDSAVANLFPIIANVLEFADDLASEIVRVEMWRDEDETE